MSRLAKSYSKYLLLLTFVFTLVGCSDELDYPHSTVEPGLPATISVNVSLPEMTPITRADMREGLDFKLKSLWIGVYNARSGERTGFKPVDVDEDLSAHKTKTVTIDAKTGLSYVVAVANYKGDNNKCLMDGITKDLTYEEALQAADTYDKFKSISSRMNDNGEIITDAPLNELLMSGHYISSNHPDNNSYTEPQSVEIPEKGSLSGVIHLRRLISQIKFEVDYNQDNISDFKVLSYQVHKVPNQSWLYDCKREQADRNPGDKRIVGGLGSFQSTEVYEQLNTTAKKDDKGNTVKDDKGNEIKTWTFDWWQLENKRTGKDWVTSYADRELEYKDEEIDEETKKIISETNTGKYKSLLAESKTSKDIPTNQSELSNNDATFVEMRVRMTMKKQKGEDGYMVDIQSGHTHVVDAVYTIHLGYMNNDPKDFNSLRNCQYTYKVNIEDVDNIKVEAKGGSELSPGAEGIVTDATSEYVELDAHYGVYNIYLDASEANTFQYVIHCYDASSTLHVFDSENPDSDFPEKYKNWIKIKKTTNKDVIAKFKGEGNEKDASGNTKGEEYNLNSLEDFKKLKISGGYYTVFIDEYVYEDASGWKEYVNKPNRQVWLSTSDCKSVDGESVIRSAKYSISQKSIQTYYGSGSKAIGIERDNESFGLNLRNTFNGQYKESTGGNGGRPGVGGSQNVTRNKGANKKNGRFNTAVYLANAYDETLSWADNSYLWSTFVDMDSFQKVDAITNNKIIGVKSTTESQVALPSLIKLASGGTVDTDYDPNKSKNYYEAINACMNRNRDLDGDGYIDADELRWYVPTTYQYTQMIIGSPSLSDPVMNYKDYPNINPKNGNNPNLIIYGSNGEVVWLMEGLSTSVWNKDVNKENKNAPHYVAGPAWQVRCVRNLGTSNSEIQSDPEVINAYELTGDVVKMTNFDSKSIRREIISNMRPHDVADENGGLNSLYSAFQFKEERAHPNGTINISDNNVNWTGYGIGPTDDSSPWAYWLYNANPCDIYNQNGEKGWRVPNQKEMTILMLEEKAPTNSMDMEYTATYAHYYQGSTSFTNYVKGHPFMAIRKDDSGIPAGCQVENYYESSGEGSKYYIRCVRDWYTGM